MKHFLLAASDPVDLGTFQAPTEAYSLNSNKSGLMATTNAERFISNTIGVLTILGGLVFLFYFVTGALNWITAGGDEGKVSKARDQMVQGVIGMIVIIASYALIGVIGSFVGLDLLHPAAAILQLKP